MNRFVTVIAVAAIALPLAIAADTTDLADRAVAFLAALDDAALVGRRNFTVPLARQVLEAIDKTREGDAPWISE